MRRDQGFTLIELLIVILIVGILAAVALPSLLGQSARGHDSAAEQTLVSAGRTAYADMVSAGGRFDTDAVSKLAAGEPSLNITDGGQPTVGQIHAERRDERTLLLRTRSRSGAQRALKVQAGSDQGLFRAWATGAEGVSNLVANPSFEYGTGGLRVAGPTSSTLTADEVWSTQGRRALRVQVSGPAAGRWRLETGPSIPIVAGRWYRLRADVNITKNARNLRMLSQMFKADGTPYGAPQNMNADVGSSVSVTTTGTHTFQYWVQARAGAERMQVAFWNEPTGADSADYRVDAVSVSEAPANGATVPYVDGDSGDAFWEGMPGQSVSTQPAWTRLGATGS